MAYALATLAAIAWLDAPLARWLATFEKPAIAHDVIHVLEYATLVEPTKWLLLAVFTAATLAVAFVPRLHRWFPQVTYVVLVALLTRNLTLWCKGATGRLRPLEWLHDGGADTFFRHGIAFPSGHVTIFASLAIPIALVCPRAWPVLAIVPTAMIARLAVDAHFASDTLGGVALVCFVAWACGPLITRSQQPGDGG